MVKEPESRTYTRSESVVFCKTKEQFGELSNMAAGFPLRVNGVRILTTEALYQACRFPDLPDVQKLIISQPSPMTAKMVGKPHRGYTRPDWDGARIAIMRWCLRLKLAFHWSLFGGLLLSTGDKPIVEQSKKDEFWGAKPVGEHILVGANVLGRLLMELREEIKRDDITLLRVVPPPIPNFLLYGSQIGEVEANKRPVVASAEPPTLLTLAKEPVLHPYSSEAVHEASIPVKRDQHSSTSRDETTKVANTMKLQRKKLIEVALPLEAINIASAREKSIRHGHPSTLHLWWARRPLAAARAVIFAQMVDDPSAWPDLFPTEKAQEKERQRLFKIIEDLVLWENTTNETVLEAAREEIRQSWRRACAENADHPQAKELFNRDKLPGFHDPFAGGGALPLEAQRLGLESYATDLNPVAVLINKAMIEIPPKFAGKPPVNPKARSDRSLLTRKWSGAQGLADDIRYYGQWMRDEATKRIGHLYPSVEITPDMVSDQFNPRPDLKPYIGRKLKVIAYLWARTVISPNPAFSGLHVPLVSTFMLSKRNGKESYVQPLLENSSYRFLVKTGKPKDAEATNNGTKLARGANFRCILSGTPISGDYIKSEGQAGRIGIKLMAVVAEGNRGRVYISPSEAMESVASSAKSEWNPEGEVPARLTGGTCVPYGLDQWGKLFTPRQLVALTTFSELVAEARARIKQDGLAAGLVVDEKGLEDEGKGAKAYAEAVGVYLGFSVSKLADLGNSLCRWEPIAQCPRQLFGRQAIPMIWDFAEGNPLGDSSGSFHVFIDGIVKAYAKTFETVSPGAIGIVSQSDAGKQIVSHNKIISTDPPYYDNIGYADLSDFFYVWLRHSQRSVFNNLMATLAVPKNEELVATSYRHGGKIQAEKFFLDGMTQAMHRIAEQSHQSFPVTIYYAFKQSECKGDYGTASTGWETFLDAVIRAGFSITGTLPIRTENESRMVGQGTNALASSIILVCRKRISNAPSATRREFINELKSELPTALVNLQRGNIAPVDLAQASIGPGMGVYTRYAIVLDASGKMLSVRGALALINEVLEEVLTAQEGDFDADTRWAVAWFDEQGFTEGDFGKADNLSRAKNTAVAGLVQAGIVESGQGKVRLLSPLELSSDWDPDTDGRLTVWEMTHYLIRALTAGGESAAAFIHAKLGSKAEAARELAYRLYTICERKKRAQDALNYNALVQSWPEIVRLAREGSRPKAGQQGSLLGQE